MFYGITYVQTYVATEELSHMIKELVNLNVQEAKNKAKSRKTLFTALNMLFILLLFFVELMVGYLYTKGTVLMTLLPGKNA